MVGRPNAIDSGTNSAIVPLTCTKSPAAGTSGAPNPVKTKSPSDVNGSPSSIPSGVWMKKPFDRCAVTTPAVVTNCPSNVEVTADPWIEAIGSVVTCSTATRMATEAVRDRVAERAGVSEMVAVIVRNPGPPGMLAVHEKMRSFAVTSPPVTPSS